MGYHIDPEKISLEEYRNKLESAYLPPGRMMLKDRLDERFGYFESIGIMNVKDLILLLKNKESFAGLQHVECLSGDYPTILLRELNSNFPKPVKIADFPGISAETSTKLENRGIKHSEHLYIHVLTKKDRQALAALCGTSEKEISELACLADLSRIKWVGTTFARMLLDAGFDNAKKVSEADPVKLHLVINQLNKEKGIYKGQIGLNDMKILVNAAKELSFDIEYEHL